MFYELLLFSIIYIKLISCAERKKYALEVSSNVLISNNNSLFTEYKVRM